jgi:hypothetical protein
MFQISRVETVRASLSGVKNVGHEVETGVI